MVVDLKIPVARFISDTMSINNTPGVTIEVVLRMNLIEYLRGSNRTKRTKECRQAAGTGFTRPKALLPWSRLPAAYPALKRYGFSSLAISDALRDTSTAAAASSI